MTPFHLLVTQFEAHESWQATLLANSEQVERVLGLSSGGLYLGSYAALPDAKRVLLEKARDLLRQYADIAEGLIGQEDPEPVELPEGGLS